MAEGGAAAPDGNKLATALANKLAVLRHNTAFDASEFTSWRSVARPPTEFAIENSSMERINERAQSLMIQMVACRPVR